MTIINCKNLLGLAALSCAPITALHSQTAVKEKMNVLFIIADDLNDWVGCFEGNPQVKTPNIDRLAKNNAMVMFNAQCASTVSCPSRSAMLTGLRPSTSGVYGNAQNLRDSKAATSVQTMPQYFSKNGYFTMSTGKIFHKHVFNGELDAGQWAFDQWQNESAFGGFPIDRSKVPMSGMGVKGTIGTLMDWGPTTVGKEKTQDWGSAQWAASKLKQDYDKPFFLMLGISKPHLTWYVPQEYFDRYDLNSIKIPEFREDDLDDILTPDGKKKFEPSADFNIIKQNNKFKDAARAYMACISYVDDCVGVVLDALDKSKYKDNTIVVFLGDHGWFLGEKLRYRKTHLWEESVRSPLIIKVPGLTKTSKCARTISFMDLYPTLADLCGLPVPVHCEGRSIVPLLKDPNAKWFPAVTTMGYKNHSVRSDQYRYNVYEDGTQELYDHLTDPMEWKNLIKDPKYSKVVSELRAYIPKTDAKPIPASLEKQMRKGKNQIDSLIEISQRIVVNEEDLEF
jgi:arylsulfatase A-like enzyme